MRMKRLENRLATIFGDYPVSPSEWEDIERKYKSQYCIDFGYCPTHKSQWSEIFGMYESGDKK